MLMNKFVWEAEVEVVERKHRKAEETGSTGGGGGLRVGRQGWWRQTREREAHLHLNTCH